MFTGVSRQRVQHEQQSIQAGFHQSILTLRRPSSVCYQHAIALNIAQVRTFKYVIKARALSGRIYAQ
ncbi:hypothetical protein BL250_08595 [Erwinia sp. OLTSP20]|nr:hypothetical protein BV501_04445 [Erwinia sp. OAMSP11]PIJ74073.1 hypothetical protein BK416_04735 [Erwinia sp. OLSSP12]PIJ81179.1 hypothetical protein BLD47_09580 [Erwinia sp. OLCASP19]PIJ86036.1 hypothetical protein BLD46_04530 [Erwinia sp. OLMTSP26]PIJ87785.1 hypothetical protein BLD49_04530 [Erwinia sp. OLMDSP33]PIJ90816.1 hypothetical protein BL249_10945 [Erwinia sp. OLFS4]PIJ92747.1 hypothetical protein BL250_08595 [Erwinia sp. OLTSP20]